MRNANYLLICFVILLASCGPSSAPKIPFKPVANDTASLMIKKYLNPDSTTDTAFKSVPKIVGFDTKTFKSFTAGNDVEGVKFILAAYLTDSLMPTLSRNTILLQIKMKKDSKVTFKYYDLRLQWDPNTNTLATSSGPVLWDTNDFVCPPPNDCDKTVEDL